MKQLCWTQETIPGNQSLLNHLNWSFWTCPSHSSTEVPPGDLDIWGDHPGSLLHQVGPGRRNRGLSVASNEHGHGKGKMSRGLPLMVPGRVSYRHSWTWFQMFQCKPLHVSCGDSFQPSECERLRPSPPAWEPNICTEPLWNSNELIWKSVIS